MGRQHLLSIEPVRTTARLIPPSLLVNVASMATKVLNGVHAIKNLIPTS